MNPDEADRYPADVVRFLTRVRDQDWRTSHDVDQLSPENRRVAALLDRAPDVLGWVHGLGHAIEYDWQGRAAQYVPAFIARARFGDAFTNVIIDVRGGLDDRDEAEVSRGYRYCTMLTDLGREPWRYVLLQESGGRTDITRWEELSADLAAFIEHQTDVAFDLAEHAGCQIEF